MRCRRLARALREQEVESGFITSTPQNALLREAADEGFSLIPLSGGEATDATAIIETMSRRAPEADVLVVDDHRSGFHARSFQEAIRRSGLTLVMISFHHEPHFVADAVLNQNLLALECNYSAESHTDLLLGPRYAVLDKTYRMLRPESPAVRDEVETVLVTFGGADHTGQTRKVVDAFPRLESPPERAIVVVGGMYSDPRALDRHLDTLPEVDTELYVNTSRMPELMAAADVGISSGGLTAWEFACLGVPNIIVSTADAQRQTGQLLDRKGYAKHLGHHDNTTPGDIVCVLNRLIEEPSRRREMARRGWQLVDGRGTDRVAAYVHDLLTSDEAAFSLETD
jgi:spore coat polysaccharide biosynthesis predicted glycosyltransferase SpsG